MKDLTLLPSQKKDVFDRIVHSEMNPAEFADIRSESRFIGGAEITMFKHVPSGFSFRFDQREGRFKIEHSPGLDTRIVERDCRDWPETYNAFTVWLALLAREVSIVDPWAAIANEPDIIRIADNDNDNSKFNESELRQIRQGIGEISDYLQNVLKINVEAVGDRLDYLEAAASRLGRKDWKVILLGVLTNIVVNAYVTPEVTREIFTFAGAALKTILVSHPLLL